MSHRKDNDERWAIAEYPGDSETGSGLLKRADVAMYACKGANGLSKLAKTGD